MRGPTPVQRIAETKRPVGREFGRQRWRDLLFLHWEVSAAEIQRTLPSGLTVDTFGGRAYVGVVPFFMERVRLAWLPPLPKFSWFQELNVRTYVFDRRGRPGVWFYSLDCNQPLAVWLARKWFHLPYFSACMRARRRSATIEYESRRRTHPAVDRFCWTPSDHGSPATPGSLEFFLVERYLLFTADRAGNILSGRVHHEPYRIHSPILAQSSQCVAELAGFDLSGPPASVLAADVVDVRIYPLRRDPK